MHADSPDQTGAPPQSSATTCASNKFNTRDAQKSSMVVPVYISRIDQKVVFAMIDTQSDTSFITEETAEELGLTGKEVRLSLSTMTATDRIVRCRRYNWLTS